MHKALLINFKDLEDNLSHDSIEDFSGCVSIIRQENKKSDIKYWKGGTKYILLGDIIFLENSRESTKKLCDIGEFSKVVSLQINSFQNNQYSFYY